MSKLIRIVSRKSKLAMCQAQLVKRNILKHHPNLDVTIIGVSTQGDEILDRSLSKIGGKGLFIKELEHYLLEGRADIAVHSLKDLPANLDPRFQIIATLEREDPSDAFISDKYQSLDEMPERAIVGTSSARRIALLNHYYPHLQTQLLRGNVITRIDKLYQGQYDGIILAYAGVYRLGLQAHIKAKLGVNQFIPAIGQGAICLEALDGNHEITALLSSLNHEHSAICTQVERLVGEALNASCGVPIGVHASLSDLESLQIKAFWVDLEKNYKFATLNGRIMDYRGIARACAKELLA